MQEISHGLSLLGVPAAIITAIVLILKIINLAAKGLKLFNDLRAIINDYKRRHD